MRIKHFTVLLTSIILILVFIPYTFAEDNSQLNLPGVAFARLGKGQILDLAYSPDGKQLAVAGSIGILIYDVETLQINAHLTDFAGKIFSVIPFLNNYIPFATFVKYLKFVIWAIAAVV